MKDVQPKKRIVPESIHPTSAATITKATDVPAVKKHKRVVPEMIQQHPSGTTGAPATAEADKGPKRINPTPVADSPMQAGFENPATASAAPRSVEPASAADQSQRRRITPVPVGGAPATTAAVPAAMKPGSVAMLAMLAGQKAAADAEKKCKGKA